MEINGPPLHPLVVHAAVIFGPIGALTAILYAVVPRLHERLRWPMLALALLATGSIVVAYLSGNDFLDSRPELGASPQVQTHEQRAENLLWATLVFGVVAIGAAILHPRQGGVRIAVSAVLMLSAAAVLVLVILTGDAGARAVWG